MEVTRRWDVESGGHVEAYFAVGGDVGPEQWGESASVFGGEDVFPGVLGEDVLEEEGVDVHERCLEDAKAQDG